MRIGFPISPEGPGGVRTWVKIFSDYCIAKGDAVSYSISDPVDVFITLANLSSLSKLKEHKERGAKIIHRMDGIFFKYLYDDQNYIKKFNQEIRDSIEIADLVIYQSDFSKKITSFLFDGKDIPGVIIYNGADPNIFKQEGSILSRPDNKKIVLSIAYWGTPLMADYSIKNILAVASSLRERKDIEFWILGAAYPKTEKFIHEAALPNVTRYELRNPVKHENMPEYIRTADIILHIRPNEACSNLIIEALHVGKPVVGLDLGGTSEVLGDAGLTAQCVQSFETFPEVNVKDLTGKIEKTLQEYDHYKVKVKERAQLFLQEEMCGKYYEQINTLMNT
ncbi:glycosyltransferase family 4 protein [Petroclostridium sp. X23]|uniref:glycosyltransferase family 4 protein n=1 Tax=Petroclostridium sp. X23 TaxID=3045146 RepID=UPI0024AD50BF|nr:glycosyltransferase family 4 protein [Petroclostridium sp. X23]WHH58336.1 glycosyltransferase family 4 protein [Petroclostridium sp. X23]